MHITNGPLHEGVKVKFYQVLLDWRSFWQIQKPWYN